MKAPRLVPGTAFLLVFLQLVAAPSATRPERIRAGQTYYAEDATCANHVCDIGEEKNYEEVFQLYSYYDATYDDKQRIVRFREYRRGDLVRTEEYEYDAEGRLARKKITGDDGRSEVVEIRLGTPSDEPGGRSDE
jgi:hypothetical protein